MAWHLGYLVITLSETKIYELTLKLNNARAIILIEAK